MCFGEWSGESAFGGSGAHAGESRAFESVGAVEVAIERAQGGERAGVGVGGDLTFYTPAEPCAEAAHFELDEIVARWRGVVVFAEEGEEVGEVAFVALDGIFGAILFVGEGGEPVALIGFDVAAAIIVTIATVTVAVVIFAIHLPSS